MPIPVTIPKATITMEEANVVHWRKAAGDSVVRDEILFEMETDKVIVEVPAPASGTLLQIVVPAGAARIDHPVGWIGQPGEIVPDFLHPAEPRVAQYGTEAAPARAGDSMEAFPASPAARRRARELGIDIRLVRGTGPGGRVTESDVERARENA